MFHRRNRRDRLWTALGYTLATLGLQSAFSCAPRSSREFVEAEVDARPMAGRPSVPDGEAGAGGSGGTGGGGGGGSGGGPAAVDAPSPPPPDAPELDSAVAPEPDAGFDLSSPDSTPPDASPPDAAVLTLGMGLVSRWKLDEMNGNMTADVMGTNPGTLNGPVRTTVGYPGALYANPGSLRFDGDNDFVALGTRSLPANDRPQTVTFWFSIAAMPTEPQICVSLTDGQEGGSRLKLGFRAGRVAAWAGGGTDFAAGAAVAAGWHHFAYTFDGTTHRLYVDGALAGMSTGEPDDGAVASARLGAGYDNAENFRGQLDEVRVYNRALTPDELMALRNGQE